jgi:hypothetical protein
MKNLREQVSLLTKLAISEDPVEQGILRKRLGKMKDILLQPQSLEGILSELGIPDYTKGYRIMIRAIQIQMEHSEPVSLSGMLYPTRAKEFGCTPSRAAKNLRDCVDLSFERAEPETIQKYFGNSIDPDKGKATTRHFIVRIANPMREAA